MAQDMKLLRDELNTLEDKRRELRGLLDKVESREMEIKQIAAGAARSCGQDQLESEILVALVSGRSEAADLAERLEVPKILVEDRLKRLKERGAVQLRDQEWSI
jgi:predicted transcriptional regulator